MFFTPISPKTLGLILLGYVRISHCDHGWQLTRACVQAGLESSGLINKRQAYALASTNLDKLLGIDHASEDADLVAFEGGSLFELSSKVAAVISQQRGLVDMF